MVENNEWLVSVLQDEDGVPAELRHLPEFKELQELKRLRKQKIRELQSESVLTQHVGYKVRRAHTHRKPASKMAYGSYIIQLVCKTSGLLMHYRKF